MTKAVQFDSYGGIDVLEVRDVPRPVPGAGEVLVEVQRLSRRQTWRHRPYAVLRHLTGRKEHSSQHGAPDRRCHTYGSHEPVAQHMAEHPEGNSALENLLPVETRRTRRCQRGGGVLVRAIWPLHHRNHLASRRRTHRQVGSSASPNSLLRQARSCRTGCCPAQPV